MNPADELVALANDSKAHVGNFLALVEGISKHTADPLALDRFALACSAMSEICSLLASRSHGLAEMQLEPE